jgi:hypothetical protein
MSEALPWLRTSRPDVVEPDGTPVRLRGVCGQHKDLCQVLALGYEGK